MRKAGQTLGRTHCPQGHEFTAENTYVGKTAHGTPTKTCRQCWRDRSKAGSGQDRCTKERTAIEQARARAVTAT